MGSRCGSGPGAQGVLLPAPSDRLFINRRAKTRGKAFALPPQPFRIRLFMRAYFFYRFRRDRHAKLLHQRHHIPIRPVFDELAAFDAGNGSTGHRACAIGRLHSKERPFVGTTDRPVHHYLIPLADHVLDGKAEVGESAPA
jgi:hypothetical protein